MPTVASTETPVDFTSNPQVRALPNYLRQFIVEQNYDAYHPVDHAVWRYIMRQNCHFLRENAHKVYFKGLLETGIDLDKIPSIAEMNDILGKIGWGAVAVDGFIPPAAFMEYQAYKVLVIAADMRQLHHIDYTPAPDIVHEAAGHAPIIVDEEYSNYLQRFGEIGALAMYSKRDYELYEAIRKLSILKETPGADENEIDATEKQVKWLQENLGEPSEIARLQRLHWWTVEYGLIGTLDKAKIYGAGLLSSIGESVKCLEPNVKKLPYTLAAADYAFDITEMQPQLFVTPDFTHLHNVLEEFADTMALRRGGAYGVKMAIDTEATNTAEYSSGLQVSGIFSDLKTDANGDVIFIKTSGATTLAHQRTCLDGHGPEYHADGFSSPVGKFKNVPRDPGDLDDSALEMMGLRFGQPGKLEFESGITVEGTLERAVRKDDKLLLLVWSNCTVTYGGETLFRPEWGTYDMAVGATITSVFCGAADKDAHHEIAPVSRTRTIKVHYTDKERARQKLYGEVRKIRDGQGSTEALPDIWTKVTTEHPDDWLLSTEILELVEHLKIYPDLNKRIRAYLATKAEEDAITRKLIEDGLSLSFRITARD